MKKFLLSLAIILFGILPFASPALAGNNCFCYFEADDDPSTVYCESLYSYADSYCYQVCNSFHLETYSSHFWSDDEAQLAIDADQCLEFIDPATVSTEVEEEVISYVTPVLSVPFDEDFAFSPITKTGSTITVGFLSEYIAMLYQYLISIMVIIAIIIIMIQGVRYATSGGGSGAGKAVQGIRSAVIGLILLLSTVAILEILNPELTIFRALTISDITATPLLPYGENVQDSVDGTLYTSLGTPAAANILVLNGQQVSEDLVEDIQTAAETINADGYGMIITSGVRTLETQLALIAQNCQNPAGSATCNPRENRPQTCILRDNDPKNCPHTTGRAVDMWASQEDSGGNNLQCIDQKTCLSNLAACFANECQSALITAMQAQGFCVLSTEPWHFEKPKMSSGCKSSY